MEKKASTNIYIRICVCGRTRVCACVCMCVDEPDMQDTAGEAGTNS